MVLLALSLVAGCGAAFGGLGKREQQPKLVVLNVKGKKGSKVRGDIVELLQTKDYALVPKADYIKTARRLKAGKLRARHITKVSSELGLDAVISGRVKRRYLYVTVHDGASGARIERFRVRLTRKRALTEDGARQLESKLMGALAEVKPASGGRDEVVAGDDDDDEDKDEELSPREKRRRAKQEARAERERKKAEARERKKAEAEARARAEREREAKEKRERERKKAEAAEIKEVATPETDDSGQAIDDEAPPGL